MALIGIRLGSLSCSPLFEPAYAAPWLCYITLPHTGAFRVSMTPLPWLQTFLSSPLPSPHLSAPRKIARGPLFLSPQVHTIGYIVLLIAAGGTHRSVISIAYPRSRTALPYTFSSFNPGALGLCNFSPRGVIILHRHPCHEKLPRPSWTIRERGSKGVRIGDWLWWLIHQAPL